jgi:crotonobetaine/carnitine-CoA ligase
MLPRSQLAPHAIAHWATIQPDQVAMMRVDNGGVLTYRELHGTILRWAAAYRRLGVRAGSHVATMIPNSAEAYQAWLGLGWLRAVEVPLNNGYTGRILQYTLSQSDSTMLVIHRRFVERLAPIAADLPQLERVVVIDDPPDDDPSHFDVTSLPFATTTQREFLDGVEPAVDLDGPEYRDITAIIYTSGTTGPSKGVITPWASMLNMWSWAPAETFGVGEALYGAFPSFHVSGKSVFNGVMVRGGQLVYREKFSATHFWDDVRRTNCVSAGLVGPMTALLWAQPARDDDADNPLRNVLLGPMIPEMEAFEKRFGLSVGTCYGMTEIGSPFCVGFEPKPWQTCGKTRTDYPWHEVRLVDDHDEEVAVGEVGELMLRTPAPWALNVGYYKMPEKTAEAWRNGWFHTGDAFRRDEEGWYYFVDRMKDSIRRRGENISSFEVENFVIEHPLVADCAAIGVPAQFGEDEVMVVCVVTDREQFSPRALIDWLEPRMPRFMLPRYVDVMDDLPRNQTSMRVLKFELRERGVADSTWDREA